MRGQGHDRGRGGATAVTGSDMSLPIIFWTIPEIRQNPIRKNMKKIGGPGGVELILNYINIWYLQT